MKTNSFPELPNLTIHELIDLYGQLILELKNRGAIRSRNVIGDLGESLAIEFYNSTPGLPKLQAVPPSTRNVDALSRNGDRYSIKATTGKTTGVFYGLPSNNSMEIPTQKFEFVIIVRFEKNYKIKGIYEISWEQFLKYKHWHSRMKAWNLFINREVIEASKRVFES